MSTRVVRLLDCIRRSLEIPFTSYDWILFASSLFVYSLVLMF
jgi:hypothetical protein